MRFARHTPRRRAPAVIIVSLIDVLLVVLIFLMITTTLKKDTPNLKLALPESSQAKTGASENKPLVVSIAAKPPYFYLEEQPVTYDKLQRDLVLATERNPQLRVAIKADKQAPFGEVIRVYDAAKTANVAGINVMAEKPALK